MLIIKKNFFCGGQKKEPEKDYSPVFSNLGCQNMPRNYDTLVLQTYHTLVNRRGCQNNCGSMKKVWKNSLISKVLQLNALFI